MPFECYQEPKKVLLSYERYAVARQEEAVEILYLQLYLNLDLLRHHHSQYS